MRMSCNGCRVLRKGCSDNCSIRPCLQWIKNPESQANATVFLAKFYGRAGLMNLLNAGPEHLRPAIFRSLLYEACGRIVNPIYGSVGLLWSGSWQMCQAAVEAVLKGTPIIQLPLETAADTPAPPLKAYDIRHISKDETESTDIATVAGGSSEIHRVAKSSRTRFKTFHRKSKASKESPESEQQLMDADNKKDETCQFSNHQWRRRYYPVNSQETPSHESSSGCQEEEVAADGGKGGSKDNNGGSSCSAFSEETADDALLLTVVKEKFSDEEVELELTLGLEPVSQLRIRNERPPPTTNTNQPRCQTLVEFPADLSLDLTA